MATQNSRSNQGKTANGGQRNLGHLFGESTRKSNLDASWNAVEPTVLLSIVFAIDALGGSVTVGSTKKGTAYFFKVFIGAPYDPMYFDGDDEGRAAMSEWADLLMAEAANAV